MSRSDSRFLATMGLLAVVIFVLCIAISGAVWFGLWNYVVVPIFNAPPISYWLACGLSVLISAVGSAFRGHSAS